jgi:AraC-like DNA-binding protein
MRLRCTWPGCAGWSRRSRACWVVIALERWLHEAGASDWTWLSVTFGWLTAAALYLLAWFGLRQRVLIPSEFVEARRSDRAVTPRYERSGLDAAHCALVAAELGRLVREERLYTDPDFDLRRLSECSGWPPNHVSQALNQGLCSNFFEFVNGFRVAAAKSCLADSDDRRSVLEIALACGFGSKSTFNTVFKRLVGSTPREYRRAPRDTAAESAG